MQTYQTLLALVLLTAAQVHGAVTTPSGSATLEPVPSDPGASSSRVSLPIPSPSLIPTSEPLSGSSLPIPSPSSLSSISVPTSAGIPTSDLPTASGVLSSPSVATPIGPSTVSVSRLSTSAGASVSGSASASASGGDSGSGSSSGAGATRGMVGGASVMVLAGVIGAGLVGI